jgi:Protein of unknown function DUF262
MSCACLRIADLQWQVSPDCLTAGWGYLLQPAMTDVTAHIHEALQMGLQQEIDIARKDIRTDAYSVSIGEWISIYEKGEIDVHPEFQRFFRWTPAQKSRLIESIFLGIPIPQIFVAQRADGVGDVVDGLQRLSTIYQFAGILRDEEGKKLEPLVLEPTKYLPSLVGYKWDDPHDQEHSLESSQRLIIKRAKIDVSIILRESEHKAKYELFQRLNTGGSLLSEQEVRNAILVMVNRDFYQWLRELSRYAAFMECAAVSDRAVEEQYDMELALRFLVFRRMPEAQLKELGDIGDFLTDAAAKIATDIKYDRAEEEQAFRSTFSILHEALASDAFRRYDPSRKRFVGGFLVSAFEAVGLGVGYNYKALLKKPGRIRENAQKLWTDPEFVDNSGSGVRASTRLPKIVPYGRKLFRP